MASASSEPTSKTTFDVYGITGRLEESILEEISTLLEDRKNRPEFQCMMTEYLKAMQIDQAETVLDLGCGTGVAACYIVSHPNFTGLVMAIDLSDYLLEIGRCLAAEESLNDRIDFRQGDCRHLTLSDSSFDAVVVHPLLSHVDDLEAVLGELARVAKPGALIGILDNDYGSMTFSNTDSQQGKTDEERFISILITNPRVMRQLPELLSRVDLDLMQHFGYVMSDVGRVNFWTSTLESFGKLLPASSAMAEEEADRWVDDRFSESDRSVFFCSCRFYSYIARKA